MKSRILLAQANATHIPLADGSVHCVVTSPPYYGLRDYGTARWDGGDPACDHMAPPSGGVTSSTLGGASQRDGHSQDGQYRSVCGRCGARRIDQQIGLEATPEEYVARMVEVFREVWRVLRDDGVVFLNLGDSYVSNSAGPNPSGFADGRANRGDRHATTGGGSLPGKNLIGIPWRVAFALQADGWYLRQDCIWHKPNPMPESVRDRCTKAHEYVFLLTKSARYYYDADAVAEPSTGVSGGNFSRATASAQLNHGAMTLQRPVDTGRRNRRSVWTITAQPYAGAHFATMPPALAELCVRAGSPVGGVVFDPFTGSGTTVMVAQKLGRVGIGIDLSHKYLTENAKGRTGLVELEQLLGQTTAGLKTPTAEVTLADLPLFGGVR